MSSITYRCKNIKMKNCLRIKFFKKLTKTKGKNNARNKSKTSTQVYMETAQDKRYKSN